MEFVNFVNFVMRFFEVKIIQAGLEKDTGYNTSTIQAQYKLTKKGSSKKGKNGRKMQVFG